MLYEDAVVDEGDEGEGSDAFFVGESGHGLPGDPELEGEEGDAAGANGGVDSAEVNRKLAAFRAHLVAGDVHGSPLPGDGAGVTAGGAGGHSIGMGMGLGGGGGGTAQGASASLRAPLDDRPRVHVSRRGSVEVTLPGGDGGGIESGLGAAGGGGGGGGRGGAYDGGNMTVDSTDFHDFQEESQSLHLGNIHSQSNAAANAAHAYGFAPDLTTYVPRPSLSLAEMAGLSSHVPRRGTHFPDQEVPVPPRASDTLDDDEDGPNASAIQAAAAASVASKAAAAATAAAAKDAREFLVADTKRRIQERRSHDKIFDGPWDKGHVHQREHYSTKHGPEGGLEGGLGSRPMRPELRSPSPTSKRMRELKQRLGLADTGPSSITGGARGLRASLPDGLLIRAGGGGIGGGGGGGRPLYPKAIEQQSPQMPSRASRSLSPTRIGRGGFGSELRDTSLLGQSVETPLGGDGGRDGGREASMVSRSSPGRRRMLDSREGQTYVWWNERQPEMRGE